MQKKEKLYDYHFKKQKKRLSNKAKIILSFVLIIYFGLSMVCCSAFTKQPIYRDSLSDYLSNKNGCLSDFGLDQPDYLLPSIDFVESYEYLDGKFFFYEEPIKLKNDLPNRSFLYLKYDEATYLEAKSFMLENIKAYNDEYYYHGDYCFFVNQNFANAFSEKYPMPPLPKWFTMACYNDANNSLIFIGYYGNVKVDDEFNSDFKDKFPQFIDMFYGEYHDFSR